MKPADAKDAELSLQLSSVQDGTYALGKAHMCSTPSLRIFPNVAFQNGSNVCLIDDGSISRPFREDRLALRLSTPHSSRRSMV